MLARSPRAVRALVRQRLVLTLGQHHQTTLSIEEDSPGPLTTSNATRDSIQDMSRQANTIRRHYLFEEDSPRHLTSHPNAIRYPFRSSTLRYARSYADTYLTAQRRACSTPSATPPHSQTRLARRSTTFARTSKER